MNKNDWLDDAPCVGALRVFFDDIEAEDGYAEKGLAHARSLCDTCPVRRRCFKETDQYEAHKAASERFGIAAGLTPHQRHSATLRHAVTCPQCDATLDPVQVRQGVLRCPRNPKHLNRVTVPIPELGDGWSKRHLTLARKVLHWMDGHPRVRNMPSITAMSEELGERWHDVKRVYEALTVDGTLAKTEASKFVRLHRSRRDDPDKWLPPHLVN